MPACGSEKNESSYKIGSEEIVEKSIEISPLEDGIYLVLNEFADSSEIVRNASANYIGKN